MITRPDEPAFSRFTTALNCREPDRVPLFEVLVDNKIKAQIIGREIATPQDDVEFWVTAGYDYVPLMPRGLDFSWVSGYYDTEGAGAQRQTGESEWGHLKEGPYSSTGELSDIRWAEEQKGFISTSEEFDDFVWPTYDDIDFSQFSEVRDIMPKNMKAICLMETGHTVSWYLMGLETYMLTLKHDPELYRKVMDKVCGLTYLALDKGLSQEDIGAVVLLDDLGYKTGPMVNPACYREYLFPWFKKLNDLCRSKGVPCILHSCGDQSRLIEDFVEVGFKGLHPIMPSAAVMRIDDVRKQVDGRLCLIGNIDLEYTLTQGSRDEVEALVKARIKTIAPGGGYILSSGNSIPAYVRVENYVAMIEACFKYGRYPISL